MTSSTSSAPRCDGGPPLSQLLRRRLHAGGERDEQRGAAGLFVRAAAAAAAALAAAALAAAALAAARCRRALAAATRCRRPLGGAALAAAAARCCRALAGARCPGTGRRAHRGEAARRAPGLRTLRAAPGAARRRARRMRAGGSWESITENLAAVKAGWAPLRSRGTSSSPIWTLTSLQGTYGIYSDSDKVKASRAPGPWQTRRRAARGRGRSTRACPSARAAQERCARSDCSPQPPEQLGVLHLGCGGRLVGPL